MEMFKKLLVLAGLVSAFQMPNGLEACKVCKCLDAAGGDPDTAYSILLTAGYGDLFDDGFWKHPKVIEGCIKGCLSNLIIKIFPYFTQTIEDKARKIRNQKTHLETCAKFDMKKIEKEKEKTFECPVCLEDVDIKSASATIAPCCGQQICLPCLMEGQKDAFQYDHNGNLCVNEGHETITCPLCRQDIALTSLLFASMYT